MKSGTREGACQVVASFSLLSKREDLVLRMLMRTDPESLENRGIERMLRLVTRESTRIEKSPFIA